MGAAARAASYLAVSVAFSWPLGAFPADRVVTRHFDLYPSAWLVSEGRDAFPTLHHAASGWPVGESLARADSYVLLLIGWLFGGLFSGPVLVSLVALLGPVASALAAEWCAHRAFAVPRPWSWLAGCAYGFSGIAATAMLEGHVAHLLNPWLPLLLGAAWRANEDAPWPSAMAAGAWWALGLFTSAYFGVIGGLFFLAIALRAGLARLLPGMLAVAVPTGLLYLWLFAHGDRFADSQGPLPELVWGMGATTLGGLAGWGDALDLGAHSIAAPVGFATLWLMGLAPVVLRGRPGWRTLWVLALGALLLALGRDIRLAMEDAGVVSPVAWLATLPGVGWFRFPARFAWIWALCGGIVGARVAAELARGAPRWLVAPLFALVVGDAVIGTGLPWRLRAQVAGAPSAYDAAPPGRAVLDLYAPAWDRSSMELELWARALACYYQGQHGRPILEVCIGTQVDSPREVVGDWLAAALLVPEPDAVAILDRLQRLGVGAVVLHADVYRESDAALLTGALGRVMGPPGADTRDGGEHVLLWVVPEGAAADPVAAFEELAVVSSGREPG